MYGRGRIYLCMSDEAGRAGVQHGLLFCPGHAVAGQPHCMTVLYTPAPPHRTKVAICASGNFWLGHSGRIPRRPGLRSIYH